MNTHKEARIVASVRDQVLDVQLGLLSPEEWMRRYDVAVEAGVVFPAILADVRRNLGASS